MKLRFVLSVLILTSALHAAAQMVLPQAFAGWQQSSKPRSSTNPAEADAAYPGILKEYGFQSSESAAYTRDNLGLKIKVARFADASGAFGAFTFYRAPHMIREKIGDNAASANNRILIQHSNLLVDAILDKVTAMSAAELRELAQDLPRAKANENSLPTLPEYLPARLGDPQTAHYIVGPNALAQAEPSLPSELVAFDRGAEVMTQRYFDRGLTSTLYIVSYPTPQIAIDRLRAFEAGMQNSPGFVVKRTGPMVVAMTGNLPISDEKAIIGSVNYEADVTWNEATSLPKNQNVGVLLVGIFTLIGILLLIGLGFSLAFGGIRVALQRFLPKRFHASPDDQFIQLNLR